MVGLPMRASKHDAANVETDQELRDRQDPSVVARRRCHDGVPLIGRTGETASSRSGFGE